MLRGVHAALQICGQRKAAGFGATGNLPGEPAVARSARPALPRSLTRLAMAAIAGCLLAVPGVAQAQLSQACQNINSNSGFDYNTSAATQLSKTYTYTNGGAAGEQAYVDGSFNTGERVSYSYTYSGGAAVYLGGLSAVGVHTAPGSGSGSGVFTIPVGFSSGGDFLFLGIVPNGPSSGTSTPGSTATFTLSCTTPAATLAVSMTHSGNGVQGQALAYTITPSTTVGPTTTATVTAAFTLPTGMTYVSASGTGWSCSGSGQSGSCTRTTPFGTGNGPAITLNVQFTATAGTPLVPSVQLSGGAASNTANASDSTNVQQAPTVTGLSPTLGSTAGGTVVTITGTNFTGVTGVSFGATAASSFTPGTATQLTATSPAGGAGAVNVRVTTAAGTSATAAANQFTYVAPPAAPVVTAPANGATVGSTTPTYTGTSDASVTITVLVDGASIGTTTASGGGTWSLAQPTALSTGSHTVRAFATVSGIVGPDSAINTFTVTPVPVTSNFTASAVAYNTGSATATTFSAAANATNSPTSYAVGSATTAQGGSVSIDSSGLVSYTPPVGFRGNDSFVFTATNAGGTSSPATVTVPVSNPVLSISLAGSGVRGTPLSGVQLVVSGGAAPYNNCALNSGALPSGVTLNADCTLSGTPTASGTFNFTANVRDSSLPTGFTQASGTLTLSIAAPTLSMSPAAGALTGATAGSVYSQSFTASGGTSSYSYARTAGTLPAGLTLSTGGLLSGTPTQTGSFSFTVTATDSSTVGSGGPYTVAQSYTLNVASPAIVLSPTTLSNGAVATAYTGSVSASGGTATYSYARTSGTLPAGVSFAANGTLSGTPTEAGTFNFTITATDSTTGSGAPYTGSRAYTITIAGPTITVSPTSLTAATVGTAYNAGISASGGTATYAYAVTSGTLPAGLTLAADGTLSGTPTQAGSFNFGVTATDSSTGTGAPFTGTRTYTLTVNAPTVTVTPTSLPNPTAGVAYSQTLTASGGTSSYSFAVTSGALPAGLSIVGNAITGTPTAAGTFNFTVTATDSSTGTGAPFTGSRAYTVTVGAATITIAPTSLPDGRAGTAYSQTVTASGGNGTYSFAVTSGSLPPGVSLSAGGVLSGTPTSSDSYSFTITATDQSTGTGAPFSASRSYSVNIFSPNFTLTAPTLSATVGQAYSGNFVAGGGTAPYTYSLTGASTIPPGLSFAANGTLSGTPTASGNFTLVVIARDSTGGPGGPFAVGSGYSFTVNPATLVVTPGAASGSSVGTSYSQANPASGGVAPYTYVVASGALPAGTALDTATGTVSGTPTTVGAFGYAIRATDSQGTPATATGATVSGTIAQGSQTISFAALSNASLSASPLTLSATASSGLAVGFVSTTTSVCTVSGTSLTLLATGTCSVTASQAGNANWAAATDVARSFTVTPATLTIATNAATGTVVGAAYTQTNPASGGLTPYTYSVSAGSLPPGTTLDGTSGTVSGTPTVAGSFSYRINVTDSQGTPVSALGSVVSVTIAKGSQTISFTSTAPSGASVGGAPYTVGATASSGLAVTYALDGSSTGCALSGTTVTFPSTGTCRINASQAGDTNWNAASQVQQSFTISAASALTASIGFAPSTLGVGQTGTMTLTFSNANASAAPAFNALITSPSIVNRVIGAPGGTCSVGGASIPTVTSIQLANVVVPSGSCTVTFNYTGGTAGSTSGFTLSAFTPAGYPTTAATSGNSFAVTPRITAIAPASGPVSQVVTISGTGFSTTPANNIVNFGSATGTVTAASSTSLTVTVPATGTGSVAVTVTVNGQTTPTSVTYTFIALPTAANLTATVPYGTATPIDLAASITGGPHSAIAIGSAPAHGTVSIAGDVVTYTPTAGYFGADSFTYTATGPGGTSNVATVTISVATPAAPVVANVSGVAVPYNGAGTAIDLSASITGVHSSIAVASAPAHGSVTVAGDVVTYTPAAGYYGPDSFTYAATGPGGTSAPATVSVAVAVPPAPTAADRSGVAIPYASTGTAIDLSGSITGVHSSIAVASAPAHGSVSVAGDVVTYTPAAGYYGPDSFTYTATGPGGTSAPATVSVAVAVPPAPTAADRSGVAVPYASTGTAIDLSGSITGVHASIAIATPPAHGTTTIAGDVVTYTPAAGYYGADSFTYTATGPGGTSAPATVGVTVATPAIPTVAGVTGVPVAYNGGATPIDLSGSITGVHSSVAIATPPAHGTASVSGNTVTYTPAAGYYGADSFTYTATGPGGTSAPATVTLDVAVPPAPSVADRSGLAVPYASTGTAIDLASAITGVHTAITIATPPAHGTASIAGDVVTYVPAAGYYGADSFTYTATGPGGTSAPATVTLTVALPPAPTVLNRSGVAVAHNSGGTAIDLASAITGVHTSIAVATAPAHGTVSVAGTVVTYTPANGYYGADSFTFTATGPGGTSSSATVSLDVALPPPPQVQPTNVSTPGSTSAAGTNLEIDLMPLIGGNVTSVQIVTQPQHGTLQLVAVAGPVLQGQPAPGPSGSLTRATVIYTPVAGFAGQDSFAFTATGPGGTSAPATIGITVVGVGPVALDKTATAGDGETISIDLTAGATGGPFTGAAVVSVAPANAATTEVVSSGSGATRTYALRVTPADRFDGAMTIRYTLSNAFGASAPATITVNVEARPDPTADPAVRAVSDAQVASTRRFAQSQIQNFMRRTEQLHNGGGSGDPDMGFQLQALDASRAFVEPDRYGEQATLALNDRIRGLGGDGRPVDGIAAMRGMGMAQNARDAGARTLESDAPRNDLDENGERRVGSVALWSGGAIEIATQDRTTGRSKIAATSSGLSAGADIKLAQGLVLGIGGGWGVDRSDIDGDAAHVRGENSVVAAYGSFAPAGGLFVDGVIAMGDLDFTTDRLVAETGAVARGARDGTMTFGALSVGIDRGGDRLRWSAYGRAEWLSAELGAYSETGAGRMDLRFDARDLTSLSSVLGARVDFTLKAGGTSVTPRLRGEWRHEFEDGGVQFLDYADIPGPASYRLTGLGWQRDDFEFSAGSAIRLPSAWVFDLELALRGSSGARAGTLRAKISKEF